MQLPESEEGAECASVQAAREGRAGRVLAARVQRRQLPEAPGTEGCSPPRGLASEPAADAPLNMGCSLCSLRKPDEQYRLLYEVRQVTVAFPPGRAWAPPWRRAPSGEAMRGPGVRWCSERDSLTFLRISY